MKNNHELFNRNRFSDDPDVGRSRKELYRSYFKYV